jgi:hypothetical protein
MAGGIMFCPNCGSEEEGRIRFCRKCGIELNTLRLALERPEALNTAAGAREEIGRAVATKISELKSGRDLARIVQHVLPQVEKFLETPEEKRLRQMRDGLITACSGIGIIVLSFAISFVTHTAQVGLIPAGAGALVLMVGIGIMLAGSLFTVPRKTAMRLPQSLRQDPATRGLDTALPGSPPDRVTAPSSVTEETTDLLGEKPAKSTNRANSV